MRKVARWDDDDTTAHNRLQTRDDVLAPYNVIGPDDGWCPSVHMY
jgi:hypothetical protein